MGSEMCIRDSKYIIVLVTLMLIINVLAIVAEPSEATNVLNSSDEELESLVIINDYHSVHEAGYVSRYFTYFTPEVFLKSVRFVVHRGLGCYYGESAEHLVVLEIWTNKPQTIELLLALYDINEGEWVSNRTVTLTLKEGVNEFLEWVKVKACSGGRFRVYAEIVRWEYDTDLRNNMRWSNEVFLKPFVDIQVFVLWRPVEQKQSWTILPGDTIEIDIGVEIPINTTHIPAKLYWRVEAFNLKSMRYEVLRENVEELRVGKPGTVWRNITLEIPWTSKIRVLANATHEWEDVGFNNHAETSIEVDPDIKLEVVEKPATVTEDEVFRLVVKIVGNVEPGEGTGWVSVVDKTTDTLLKRVSVSLEPEKIIELEVKVPKNPSPSQEYHTILVQFTGYDMYEANNKQEFTLLVKSRYSSQPLTVIAGQQTLWILVVIAMIVAVSALVLAIKALKHRH